MLLLGHWLRENKAPRQLPDQMLLPAAAQKL
jgi:hypothetical protein